MAYGIPYKGSKNKIAEWVVSHFPEAEHFYDVFAGGCAVTHAAMLSGKFKVFHLNDIQEQYPRMFVDAAHGRFKDGAATVTREEFHRLKNKDPYVAACWSFGNNCRNYLWGKDIEEIKYIACDMVLNPSWERRFECYKKLMKTSGPLPKLDPVQRLKRLQIAGIPPVEITVTGLDYAEIAFEKDSVVYCDPPYSGTDGYGMEFDHCRFYDWLRELPCPAFVSEYSMPDDFTELDSISKTCSLSAHGGGKMTMEKLFMHKKWKP